MTNPPNPHPGESDYPLVVICPVDKPLLRMLRRFITAVAEEMGFSEDDAALIELAVDEACSNIARHAYHPEDRRRHEIELAVRVEPDALAVRVRDWGDGGLTGPMHGAVDFEDYSRPERERYDGLGLLIMHKFMDEVNIEAHPGQGTTVKMRKRLHSPRVRQGAAR